MRSSATIRRVTRAATIAVALGAAAPAALPVAAVPVIAPAAAEAATYHMYACKLPSGATTSWNDWAPVGTPGVDVNEGCKTDNGQQTDDMGAYVGAPAFAGRAAGWSFTAPVDTSIASATFERLLYNSRRSHVTRPTDWAAWIGIGGPTIDKAFDACASGCEGKGYPRSPVDANPIVTSGPVNTGARTVYAMAGCVGTGPSCITEQNYSWYGSVRVKRADIEIRDDLAPTGTTATGPLAGTGAHRGVETMSYTATDRGGGLYRTRLELRAPGSDTWTAAADQRVDANGGKCVEADALPDTDNEFLHAQPCVLSSDQQLSLDTTLQRDGEYRMRVSLEDAAGNIGYAVPERPLIIDNVPAPANLTPPTVTGGARVGATLTATPGSWTGAGLQFSHQWQRCSDPAGCEAIDGATSATYKPTDADIGRTIRVVVTATNAEGATSAPSATTAAIPIPLTNTALPAITGIAKVGETLTTTDGAWSGATGATYKRQWQHCAIAEVGLPKCSDIAGATGSTYKVTADDVGKVIRVVVTAAGPDGSATATSKDTEAVRPGATQTAPSDPPAGGGGGGKPPVCKTCDPAPAPAAPSGADPEAANGDGGTPATGRFASESRQTIRARYGAKRVLTGRVVDATNTPIANAAVDVLIAGKRVGSVVTDAQGRYRWTLPTGVSRNVVFAYRPTLGAATYRDTATVRVKVLGVLRVRAKRTTLGRSARLRLTGALLGGAPGADVQVQARDGRAWRTIDVIKTGKGGRLTYSYRFKRVADASFMFRLRMSGQPKVKLGAAVSKPIRIRVR